MKRSRIRTCLDSVGRDRSIVVRAKRTNDRKESAPFYDRGDVPVLANQIME